MLTLEIHGRMGRTSLKKLTGLGEGVIRRIMNILKELNAIKTTRGGAELTQEGRDLLRRFLNELGVKAYAITDYMLEFLNCKGRTCITFLLNRQINERSVVMLRDEALKKGCNAALIMTCKCEGGLARIYIPPLGFLDEFNPSVNERLKADLGGVLECNDSVITLCGLGYVGVLEGLMAVIGAQRTF